MGKEGSEVKAEGKKKRVGMLRWREPARSLVRSSNRGGSQREQDGQGGKGGQRRQKGQGRGG